MKNSITILYFLVCTVSITFSQNYKFGKISNEELSQKSHPTDPSANAAILYREHKTNFEYSEEDGFYAVTEVFERIKIYKKEGFDWATKNVYLYQGSGGSRESMSGLKGVTYYLDTNNKIEEVKLNNDGIFEEKASKFMEISKFTMPDVKEGCVIEYKYRIKSPFISNIDEYKFQETIPVDNVYLRFSAPEYLVYKTHQKGWIPIKIDKDGKDRTMNYRYTESALTSNNVVDKTVTTNITFREDISEVILANVPAIKEESFTGNINNYTSSLKFELSYTKYPNSPYQSYTHTWEDVSKTAFEASNFGGELTKTNYFEEDIDNITKGVSNESDKMLLIFEYVKTKMTWNSFSGMFSDEGVKDAYKKGEGNVADINLMLTAMLRHSGLNANPVLVSTKSHGIPIYPTLNGFNYVIASVFDSKGTIHLLDATNKNNEINLLESKLLNWQGRIISKDGNSTWVPLSPKEPAITNTMVSAEIANDFSVKGTSQNRFTGHYTMMYRNKFSNLSEDEKRKLLEEEKGETEIAEIEFENLQKLYEPIKLTYSFQSFDAVEDINGKLYLSPMLFLATKESPFKLDERMYPIDYGYPVKDRILVSIAIPEGYQIESLPESVQFGLGRNMGSYRYSASQNAGKIQLSVEFAINEPVIASTSYGDLKMFYQLLIDKEKEKIVLSKI